MWSSISSSKKTNSSPFWGISIPLRKLRLHPRLTLRRRTPPRPSKNPKRNLKSTEDGNSGSFKTRGVWRWRAVWSLKPTGVQSVLLQNRGERANRGRRGRHPVSPAYQKGLRTNSGQRQGVQCQPCQLLFTVRGCGAWNPTWTLPQGEGTSTSYPRPDRQGRCRQPANRRLSLCAQLKLIIISKQKQALRLPRTSFLRFILQIKISRGWGRLSAHHILEKAQFFHVVGDHD